MATQVHMTKLNPEHIQSFVTDRRLKNGRVITVISEMVDGNIEVRRALPYADYDEVAKGATLALHVSDGGLTGEAHMFGYQEDTYVLEAGEEGRSYYIPFNGATMETTIDGVASGANPQAPQIGTILVPVQKAEAQVDGVDWVEASEVPKPGHIFAQVCGYNSDQNLGQMVFIDIKRAI